MQLFLAQKKQRYIFFQLLREGKAETIEKKKRNGSNFPTPPQKNKTKKKHQRLFHVQQNAVVSTIHTRWKTHVTNHDSETRKRIHTSVQRLSGDTLPKSLTFLDGGNDYMFTPSRLVGYCRARWRGSFPRSVRVMLAPTRPRAGDTGFGSSPDDRFIKRQIKGFHRSISHISRK